METVKSDTVQNDYKRNADYSAQVFIAISWNVLLILINYKKYAGL